MPSGLFGKAKIVTINSPTQIGGVAPPGKVLTLNLRIVNPGATDIKTKTYICTTAAPAPADDLYTPQNVVKPPFPLDETAIILAPGERLFFEADTLGVIARAVHFEEPA